jgi:hypothetical protein
MSEDGGEADDTLPASGGAADQRSSVPAVPPPPDARYRLGQELGRGGMGRVVEAFDTHLQRTVALKEVLPNAGNIERRFQREVRITARLEHAAIVPLYDSGRLADGRAFYVMRRVSGKPLDEMIARATTLEERLGLLPNVLSAIEAVAHAHSRGVVHRDVKPQNILVGELGETVVIDWGLAKVIADAEEPVPDSLEPRLPSAADSLQTQVGSVFGTPGFMAPEQARGDDLGAPADVYALGATLYQMVVGKPPFGGTSATDVITSTLRHRMEPIARAAPGAPPELVTIIEKALAFDAKHRYRDAGELAEDVRRFLTGQLVGAHRYTPRQRMARFARRNRAALIVAALATAGIAVLAWVSVHRIVRERDAAQIASIEAQRQRAVADERAREVRERADQLMLLYARGLLDTNPSHAMAVLKDIDPSREVVLDEARAIARAALSRGVAWGIPSLPDITHTLEMSPDGKRVVQINLVGDLQVIDLDTRRQVATSKLPRGTQASWVAGGRKLFIQMFEKPPAILDPITGVTETLAIDPVSSSSITADGARVAALTSAKELVLIDAATKQITKVPMRRPVRSVLIAPDGGWIACEEQIDDKRLGLVVVDTTGRVLAQREGSVQAFGASAAGRLAVVLDDGVYEIASMTQPVLTRMPTPSDDWRFIHQILYRKEKPYFIARTTMFGWSGKELVQFADFPKGAMVGLVMRDGVLAVSSNDGRVMLMQNGGSHALQATSRAQGIMRIAGVPGASRLVATTNEAVLVWNVDDVMPRVLPVIASAAFVTESLVVNGAPLLEWESLDLATGVKKAEPLVAVQPIRIGLDVMPDDGRLLVVSSVSGPDSQAIVGYPDAKQLVIKPIAHTLVRLVQGGAVVYSPGKGRVFGKVGDEDARELVTLDGDVTGVTGLGKLGFAAVSAKGELVRGGFDGSHFSRMRVPDANDHMFVVGEPDGGVLVADGNRLLRWPAAGASKALPPLEDVARFDSSISWMHATTTGAFVVLQGNELMFVRAAGDRTPRRLPVGDTPKISHDGSRVVSYTGLNEVEVLELPSMVAWSLPPFAQPSHDLAISPSGRRLYHSTGPTGVLWTIPEPGSDFAAWLDDVTNATDVDRHLRWPWQPGAP